MTELGKAMSGDFQRLQDWQQSSNATIAGDAFSIYEKWELSKNSVTYVSGFPIESYEGSLPSGFMEGEIPKLETFNIDHIGAYRHLGNAWSQGMQMSRGKEFLIAKGHKPFETYTDVPKKRYPGEPEGNDAKVSLHFPRR